MTNEEIAAQLRDIQGKLDIITEEMAARKRQREDMQELKNDLAVIANDVYKTAVVELEDIAPFVNTGDFVHLMKKILRNTNSISATISKLESVLDFFEDFKPIGNDMFNASLHKLDELETKGYFRFGKELARAIDQELVQLSPEDMKNLAENTVRLVKVLKILANSKLIPALEETAHALTDEDAAKFDRFSPWVAYKELRKPEIRRAVGLSLHFLKTFVNETNNHHQTQGDT